MLNSVDLGDKKYEDLIAEAISQISLYSSEWTNFNVSDPGITVLQNFSAFHLLQQNYINEVTETVKRKLLKMLHFEARKSSAARVLLQAQPETEVFFPKHRKMTAGSLMFETTGDVTIHPWGLAAIYSKSEQGVRDLTYLLDRDVQMETEIFGRQPEAGMALYCILSGMPEIHETVSLYVKVGGKAKRNPFEENSDLRFATTVWQYYTDAGWQDAEAVDETSCFLLSGEVRLRLSQEPAFCDELPISGFALRCVLKTAEYDLAPCLHSISANLFEAVQKETKAASFTSPGAPRIEISSELAAFGYMFVYCREEENGPYRAYREFNGRSENGRYYLKYIAPDGTAVLSFDEERFGFGPCNEPDSVKTVCYDAETVHHRQLGSVFGYEDQVIDIDLTEHILEDEFCLILETVDEQGESEYAFCKPGETDPDQFCYRLLAEPGQVVVTHMGIGGDCRLYQCDCAVTAGNAGNIRPGNHFIPLSTENMPDLEIINPAVGKGGVTSESVEDLRLRFVADIKRATTAVLASDYEVLVKKTPGLCIHKVKAIINEEKNIVKISVMPYTQDKLPKLSALYAERISKHLEPFRMITTELELLQPKYIPINVQATINVKSYFENARTEIETLLKKELDFVSSEHAFGEVIQFNDIFRKIEALTCVDSVYSLVLTPQVRGDVALAGMDIRLGSHCLCYPGKISLELNSRMRASR